MTTQRAPIGGEVRGVRRTLAVALLAVGAAVLVQLTGGQRSPLFDLFGLLLVISAVTRPPRRVLWDSIVVVGLALFTVAGTGGPTDSVDLAVHVAVWMAMAGFALASAGRARQHAARAGRLQGVIDRVEDLVLVLDTDDLRIVYANHAATERPGLTPDEVIGRHPWDWTDALSEERVNELIVQLRETGQPVRFEHTATYAGSHDRVYETIARLVDEGEGTERVALVARNVTAQRLEAGRNRELAAMVEASDVAMVGCDLRGYVRTWNAAAARTYGISADQAVGGHIASLVNAVADEPISGTDELPRGTGHVSYCAAHRARDGRELDVEVTLWPHGSDDRGGPDGVAVVLRDITLDREAEKTVREREQRFRTLAEQSMGVVYRVALVPDMAFEYVSPQVCEVLGDAPEDIVEGRVRLIERLHAADRRLLDFSDPTHPHRIEGVERYRLRRTDGTWIWVEDHHRPELDARGRMVGSQGMLFDVSERMRVEQAQAEALEHERALADELHRVSVAQQTFLRSISHEVRTPLTIVGGFARTLLDQHDRIGEEQRRQLTERLAVNAERLGELLGDLLEVERIDHDAQRERWRRLQIHDLVRAAVDRVAGAGDDVRVDLPDIELVGDGPGLARAVAALVANAIKHAPDGTPVEVSAVQLGTDIVIHVEDQGPGVEEHLVEAIFEPFVQGPEAASAPKPGVGIGLARVRQVALLHGGAVWYEPRETGGARFCLRLPMLDALADAAIAALVKEAAAAAAADGPGHEDVRSEVGSA